MTWFITGNSNASTASFLGTTNLQPLVIKTNDKEAMRVASADGDVSIGELGGTRDPDYKLDVQGILNADDIYKGGTELVGSQWEDVQSGISYAAGNVGVGKAPGANYKLDVAGTLNATDLHKNGSPLITSQWQNVSSGISYAAGNVGVGMTAPGARLAVAATSVSNEVARGIYARADGDQARGIDVTASGDGTGQKMGIRATASGGGDKWAGYFSAFGTAGEDAAFGLGCGATGDGTGPKYGIRAMASGGGEKRAGYFIALSDPQGVNMPTYGIYAHASGAGTVYAGWFEGDVHAGSLETPGGKSFLIDHPLDPENKTLRHNSVESPENLCLYRGKVKLGPNGSDTVRMPNYFAALINEDEATAYLTPVGKEPFPTSYEWNEAHTELTIFGTEGAEVAYLVLADRDDRTMHLFSRPVEEEKGGSNFERGKLLSPEAFELPSERGVAPLLPQEEQTIRAEPIPPRAVPPEPIAPEMPAEDEGEGSD